jgi:hypothetical protein
MKALPLACVAALLAAGPLRASVPTPYTAALACAGIAEAAARRDPGNRAAFDAALYWGMAASERAREDKLPAKVFTRHQKGAAASAAADLEAGKAEAVAFLASCIARVPALPLEPR